MSKITNIDPRDDWYTQGDYIAMIVDEGSKNPDPIRAAQLQVAVEEQRNSTMLMAGESKDGHEFPSGPYLWKTTLFSLEDIERITKDEAEWNELKDHQKVIACSTGGDSFGFGYNWILDEKTDEIFMTEDPKGSRVKFGLVENVPASILSDIERIDAALESYEINDSDGETLNVAKALDALHDARHGLLYLSELLTEAKGLLNDNQATTTDA